MLLFWFVTFISYFFNFKSNFCQFINGGLWVYRLEATELDELDKQTDSLALLWGCLLWYIFVSMNFRVIAMDELKDVFLKLENYSLIEVLYVALTTLEKGKELGWLLEKTDKELYTALNKIVKNEREEDEKN